jgi:hypothetical protein
MQNSWCSEYHNHHYLSWVILLYYPHLQLSSWFLKGVAETAQAKSLKDTENPSGNYHNSTVEDEADAPFATPANTFKPISFNGGRWYYGRPWIYQRANSSEEPVTGSDEQSEEKRALSPLTLTLKDPTA